MDPDANLREQRAIAVDVMAIWDNSDAETCGFTEEQQGELTEHAIRLAELVQALDQWISRGGFLPQPWQNLRDGITIPRPVKP